MIEGTIPLITLWLIVIGSVTSLVLHAHTRWWRTRVGLLLFCYLAVVACWYTELLIASYAGYPTWMQAVEAVTFIGIATVVVWQAALQLWWRRQDMRTPPDRLGTGERSTDPGAPGEV